MKNTNYVALLRGINVGGSNLMPMTELRTCFEKLGFSHVATYIQSGNVLFSSPEADQAKLTRQIEEALFKTFHIPLRVVLLSQRDMRAVIDQAPRGFGDEPTKYRYDVIFIKAPLTPAKAMAAVETKEGVDDAHAGRYTIYFRRLEARVTASRVSKIVAKPEYQFMTIRNWNTTTRLLKLLEDRQ